MSDHRHEPDRAEDDRQVPDDATREPSTDHRPATPVTQQIGRITVLVLLVIFIVFAVSNSQPVDFSWVFGETQVTEDATGETAGGVPLIVLLLVAFLVGALSSPVLLRMGRRRRARSAAERND